MLNCFLPVLLRIVVVVAVTVAFLRCTIVVVVAAAVIELDSSVAETCPPGKVDEGSWQNAAVCTSDYVERVGVNSRVDRSEDHREVHLVVDPVLAYRPERDRSRAAVAPDSSE